MPSFDTIDVNDATYGEVREQVAACLEGEAWPRHAVYILHCENAEIEALRDRAEDRLGYVPRWTYPAHRADDRFYVGMSSNVVARIYAHFVGRGSYFTKVFEPTEVRNVVGVRTREEAERYEGVAADRLADGRENVYVHCPQPQFQSDADADADDDV